MPTLNVPFKTDAKEFSVTICGFGNGDYAANMERMHFSTMQAALRAVADTLDEETASFEDVEAVNVIITQIEQ